VVESGGRKNESQKQNSSQRERDHLIPERHDEAVPERGKNAAPAPGIRPRVERVERRLARPRDVEAVDEDQREGVEDVEADHGDEQQHCEPGSVGQRPSPRTGEDLWRGDLCHQAPRWRVVCPLTLRQ
jgi:hypothetical protein